MNNNQIQKKETYELTEDEQRVKYITNNFTKPAVIERLNSMSGGKGTEIASIIISCGQKTPALAECTVSSLIASGLAAYILGLNFSTSECYMIPYGDQAQFQVGYKGIIQLAQRSGYYERINAMEVKEGELEDYDPLEENYKFNWVKDKAERAKLPTIGYVMFFKLTNGFIKRVYWTKEEMEWHAREYSQSYKNDLRYHKSNSFWSKNFDEMAKKTLYKLVLDKFGPKSIKMAKAIEQDQATLRVNEDNQIEIESYIDDAKNKKTYVKAEEVPLEEDTISQDEVTKLCQAIVDTGTKVPDFMNSKGIVRINQVTKEKYKEYMKELGADNE